MPVPESLSEKIHLFRERGHLNQAQEQFFSNDSWCSILEGMKIRPQKYHPLIEGFDSHGLANTLNANVENIRSTVLKMPDHYDYIQANCQAR
jgi:tryptophan halogenase